MRRKDVRELQLAKSAIRAGIEVLLLKYGVRASDVKQIYLAGGFGYRLDAEKAIAIGMIPKAFEGRIQAVGNSSLAGTSKYLLSTNARKHIEHILEISKEINLGSEKTFNDFYMYAILFDGAG